MKKILNRGQNTLVKVATILSSETAQNRCFLLLFKKEKAPIFVENQDFA